MTEIYYATVIDGPYWAAFDGITAASAWARRHSIGGLDGPDVQVVAAATLPAGAVVVDRDILAALAVESKAELGRYVVYKEPAEPPMPGKWVLADPDNVAETQRFASFTELSQALRAELVDDVSGWRAELAVVVTRRHVRD